MKKLREVVYKALVINLGVPSHFLSRIEDNLPICIELTGGEEIYIHLQNETLQIFLEKNIPDQRVVIAKSNKILDILYRDGDVFLCLKKEKIIFVSEFSICEHDVENVLTQRLKLFNNLINQLKG
ncbi:hypothetical protein NPV54_000802 [Vibrio cholerae]|uniref:hypothetical protein n=3 Tax=Vibrio cholerae TaxID=666 RepID=UPI000E0B5615|nr:hypothetical protein [Vibrio cholerae]EGQ7639675.1 hypothetical protein [Vibrio cholerae]EHE6925302.1 hypothetical protein [Vibrio cholerae]EHE6949005.1 hypothetical protein [Vibrio cholerae]EJN3161499.1 hypothetical protein [Vibrio cholerae]EJX7572165.1 hypothetical protein [Vibrio cholerae]